MFEILYSWETWILVIFIIFVFLIALSKGNDENPKSTRYYTASETSSYNDTSYTETDWSTSSIQNTEDIPQEFRVPQVNVSSVSSISNSYHEEDEYNNGKKYKKEELCRKAMEQVYGAKFVTVRPKWLKNPKTGRSLEIDGYNSKLKVGFECNGRQHDEYIPFFHKNGISDFEEQKYRDNVKLDICDKMGIYIHTIPHYISDDKILDFVKYWSVPEVKKRGEKLKSKR